MSLDKFLRENRPIPPEALAQKENIKNKIKAEIGQQYFWNKPHLAFAGLSLACLIALFVYYPSPKETSDFDQLALDFEEALELSAPDYNQEIDQQVDALIAIID